MELIFKIIAIGLITCFASLIIKPVKQDFAILICVVGGLIILVFVIKYLSTAFSLFQNIINKTGLSKSIFTLLLKIISIAYLTEFSASLCNDCGSASLGDKVLLGGKIVLLVMAFPIISKILEIVMELLP